MHALLGVIISSVFKCAFRPSRVQGWSPARTRSRKAVWSHILLNRHAYRSLTLDHCGRSTLPVVHPWNRAEVKPRKSYNRTSSRSNFLGQ